MNPRSLARVAIVGLLAVTLVATLVLSGAGMVLDDPEQRAQGDAVAGEHTLQGTVVAEDPVTIETDDGQRIVLDSVDPAAVEEGQPFEVAMTLEEPGADTNAIARSTGEAYFMYGASALAGLLVLVLLLDTWRLRPLQLRFDPRARPLHDQVIERVRGRYAEGRVETLDPRRQNPPPNSNSTTQSTDPFDRGGTNE